MRVVSFAAAIALVLIVLGMSQPAEAQESQLDALRAAARAAPRDPLAALALGTALRRADRLPAALAELRRGIAIAGMPETLRLLEWEVVRVEGDRHDFCLLYTS